MAAGLASLSPIEIIPHLFYPILLTIAIAVSILIKK
jgi:hypothetical protein